MTRFAARCLDSVECTAVMHMDGCASIRANLRSPLPPQLWRETGRTPALCYDCSADGLPYRDTGDLLKCSEGCEGLDVRDIDPDYAEGWEIVDGILMVVFGEFVSTDPDDYADGETIPADAGPAPAHLHIVGA